ncbi:MAG: riboflavin synthase [Candidatus Brocadiaceae bacterium]|nr:riboflavin synthase [Candidatus Brocadiaceae bacterium]
MFTGIVQHVGTVQSVVRRGEACSLGVDCGPLAAQVAPGDSVCVDGACLTATAIRPPHVQFDAGAETLRLTTLGEARPGRPVNLELALRLGDRLGGHFVSGHVDGTGTVRSLAALPGEVRLTVEVPPALADQMVMKGSVAVDGVSLTIASLDPGAFQVSVIPHTLAQTTLRCRTTGARVNIECDLIGRWVRRLLRRDEAATGADLTIPGLQEQGF